jgi:hypothetical protein
MLPVVQVAVFDLSDQRRGKEMTGAEQDRILGEQKLG